MTLKESHMSSRGLKPTVKIERKTNSERVAHSKTIKIQRKSVLNSFRVRLLLFFYRGLKPTATHMQLFQS